jgi:hypothetical protein
MSAGRLAVILAAAAAATAASRAPAASDCRFSGAEVVLAVLPVDNRSGGVAPTRDLEAALHERLASCGLPVVPDDPLERFLGTYRVRYTGGISEDLRGALREELGATAVLVSTLDHFDPGDPPALAMTSRVVGTARDEGILWIDDLALVGDEAPGFLGMSVVHDVGELIGRAADRLVRSLADALSDAGTREARGPGRRFRPRSLYRSQLGPWERGEKPRIAVLPFRSEGPRRQAGELVALQVVRHLAPRRDLQVVEPGLVRQALLQARLVAEDGVSGPQVDLLRVVLKADLVVTGAVFDYEDGRGLFEPPVVDFTTTVFDATQNRVVWSSLSHGTGADGVYLFDWGRIRTAHALSSRMARAVVHAAFR